LGMQWMGGERSVNKGEEYASNQVGISRLLRTVCMIVFDDVSLKF
jgi:hypothetical protein